jgi:hypothetical protein
MIDFKFYFRTNVKTNKCRNAVIKNICKVQSSLVQLFIS